MGRTCKFTAAFKAKTALEALKEIASEALEGAWNYVPLYWNKGKALLTASQDKGKERTLSALSLFDVILNKVKPRRKKMGVI